MSINAHASPARRSFDVTAASFSDAAAFGVLLVSAVAIPVTFSIANADVFAMPKTIVAIGLAVVLLGLLIVHAVTHDASPVELLSQPLAWAVGAYVAWTALATLLSIDPERSLVGEPRQFQGLGISLAYAVYLAAGWITVRTPRRRTVLLVGIAAAAAVVAGYAVIQGADLDPIWRNEDGDRAFSTIGQANALAAYLVIAVPLSLALAIGRGLIVQALVTGLVILELVALAFTLSRGGFLGLGVAAVVLVALLWRRHREVISRHAVAIVAVAVLATGALVAGIPDLREGAERAIDRVVRPGSVEEASTSAHLDQWAVGVAIALDHPLLGTGPETYPQLFGDYRDAVIDDPERAEMWRRYRPESPHNHYIAIAAGAGLPALVAYLALIAIPAWRAGRALPTTDRRTLVIGACILAAIGGHLVTDAFMTAEATGSVLFWTLLGVAGALGAERAHMSEGIGLMSWK